MNPIVVFALALIVALCMGLRDEIRRRRPTWAMGGELPTPGWTLGFSDPIAMTSRRPVLTLCATQTQPYDPRDGYFKSAMQGENTIEECDRTAILGRPDTPFDNPAEVKRDPLAGLGIGRIVHYVFQDGTHRPAMVVHQWCPDATSIAGRGCIQLQVFLDGTNDIRTGRATPEEGARGMAWRTSVNFSEDAKPGTWHWPERGDVRN